AVGGADERPPGAAAERLQLAVHLLLLGEPVVLDLEVVASVEDAGHLLGGAARAVELAQHEVVRHLAAQAAREGDQAAVQLAQELLVDAWLVVEALAVARADQPAEVAVPLLVHGPDDPGVVSPCPRIA